MCLSTCSLTQTFGSSWCSPRVWPWRLRKISCVCQRPFADATDLRARVNAAMAFSNHCVGPKLVEHFDSSVRVGVEPPARTRNVHYARELLALNIDIPWSAWEGYKVGSDVQARVVWDYSTIEIRNGSRFIFLPMLSATTSA